MTIAEIIAFGSSMLVHAILLLVMAMIALPEDRLGPILDIISSQHEEPEKEEPDLTDVPLEQPEVIDNQPRPAEIVTRDLVKTDEKFDVDVNDLDISSLLPEDKADAPSAKAPLEGALSGRSQAGKSALVAQYGGNEASEVSVVAGLHWLSRHQNSDGSWSFDHVRQACRGSCTQPGSLERSHMGATAMAMLAYMGAGHTFSEGEFQPVVLRGLNYLMSNLKMTPEGADLRGAAEANSGMYIQGICTIALCEALAMNEASIKGQLKKNKSRKGKKSDEKEPRSRIPFQLRVEVAKRLRLAAQAAVNFIMNAQHEGGGWRYSPGQAGDTSVVGWQVMALHSAHSAGLKINPLVVRRTALFLDSVQADGGAKYGYTAPASRPSTTAIGLLCRMYMGWDHRNSALKQGVEYLSAIGPAKNDMYYNYYATQVMLQWGGDAYAKKQESPNDLTPDEIARAEIWEKWNKVMRTQLVTTQVKDGHARGSWDVADSHGNAGGRLYMTCLCTMTLEVYYRHLPLYQHKSGEGGVIEAAKR